MSLRLDPEETAALAVFAELGRTPGSNDTRVTAAEDEVEEVLRRLNLEGLGLMAWALDPVAPAPGSRAELLERLEADSTQEVPPLADGPAPEPATAQSEGRAAEPAEEPAREPAPAFAERRPDPFELPPAGFAARAAGRHRQRWALPLAAGLGVAVLGLGLTAAWLASELSSTRYRLTRIESQLEQRGAEAAEELAGLRAEVAALEQRRQFAAGPATVVFPLRPPAGSRQPLARGKLWVAADHQHWQLEVSGLAPSPEGQEYQVWFMVDGIPLDGGCFRAERGRTAALASAEMPEGTTGVAITLERAGGARAPTTPVLIEANRAVEL